MDTQAEQEKIVRKGLEIFDLMAAGPPAVFDKRRWAGELMALAMRDPLLKVQLFRFIDVFPALATPEMTAQHLKEYFPAGESHLPDLLQKLLAGGTTGPVAGITAFLLRRNIHAFARTFIIGESPEKALKPLKRNWEQGRTFTVDILGEAALSEKEATDYFDRYLALVAFLARETVGWKPQAAGRERWFPRVNVSVKATSLYSRIGPLNYEDSVERVKERLREIFSRARQLGAFINLDMEMYSLKAITLDIFMELLDEQEFQGWDGAGIALQAYLKETEGDLRRLADWARKGGRRITVRLVKGAYWEYETIVAAQKGWPVPVFAKKAHTDGNYERCAEWMLANSDCITPAFGTHNVRSIASVLAAAERLGVPAERFEFQMLLGMAEPIKEALRKLGQALREYTPTGELLPGMAYLVRRLLENTSNEGFLHKTFVDNTGREALLAAPEPWPGDPAPQRPAGIGPFANEPTRDFSVKTNRAACREAVARVQSEFGRDYPAVIGGREWRTGDTIVSSNPARPEETVGRVAAVSRELADRAVAAAREAQTPWGKKSPGERAECLFRAAAIARGRRAELLAWQVAETGKNWAEADADVVEAIDYLEYYGREALRLGKPLHLGRLPGEVNRYHYQPRGTGVVIAPWNFPLAISLGMVSAALVAGNAVLYKPSSLSPVNGWQAFSLLREAGVPDGILNFIPGRGETVGEFLAGHPRVDFIAFTGSRDVGLRIVEQAGKTVPAQQGLKRVVVEMGGKNAVIVDADADLDQAVAGVMQSAFGYQGQKCSACSRAIVLEGCYDRFMERLAAAVAGIVIGPPEDPANFMGPLIDEKAKAKVKAYMELAAKEGKIVGELPAPDGGHYVPPMVVADLPRDSRLLREEIFGPLLAVIKVREMGEALERANETDYALTGGLYSRSPANIRRVADEFRVGNLYINRPITGAMVGRQPFGGFRMSGIGSKAGGPDYLLQFMEPRVVTENTLRRGFTPEVIS